MTGCWNMVGVRGDRSCPELVTHVHCRNCPVYGSAALSVLDREPPAEHLADWTSYVATPFTAPDADRRTLLIFRVGAEWLALPGRVVQEVSEHKPIHSLPHRRRGPILGLVSIRGELLVCLSLARVLGLDPHAAAPADHAHPRMLVLRRGDSRMVCIVDDVHGLESVTSRTLADVPATIAKGSSTHANAVVPWRDRSVGILDESVLFASFGRSLT